MKCEEKKNWSKSSQKALSVSRASEWVNNRATRRLSKSEQRKMRWSAEMAFIARSGSYHWFFALLDDIYVRWLFTFFITFATFRYIQLRMVMVAVVYTPQNGRHKASEWQRMREREDIKNTCIVAGHMIYELIGF